MQDVPGFLGAFGRTIRGRGSRWHRGEARAARAEATAAQEAGDEALFEELNATATSLEGKVNTLFRGETLRGLLLFSWGWWLVGQIAFWVGIGLFLAAVALMIAAFMTRPKADKATKAPAPDGSHERIETPAGV